MPGKKRSTSASGLRVGRLFRECRTRGYGNPQSFGGRPVPWTQADLSQEIGYSVRTIRNWETGAVLPDFNRLADFSTLFAAGLPPKERERLEISFREAWEHDFSTAENAADQSHIWVGIEERLPPRHGRKLLSLQGGDRLEGHLLKEGVDDLIQYAKRIEPAWIVGVHPGGRLVSAFVGDQIGLPSYRCLFIRTNRNRVTFIPPINVPLEGTVLFIDDIVRSGRTFDVIKRELKKNYRTNFLTSKMYVAVLTVEFEYEEEEYKFRPDFAAYRTELQHLRFPWSEFSAKIGVAITRKNDGRAVDEAIIDEYARLIGDYGFACELGKKYLGK